MPKEKTTADDFYARYVALGRNGYALAKDLGMQHSAVCKRIRRIEATLNANRKVVVHQPSDPDVPISVLMDHKKARYERLRNHEESAKLIKVRLRDKGVIALVMLGDPHLDNDGTDVGAFEQHCELIANTDGMYCTILGDVTDNWVGRLAKLYAQSSTTEWDAWRLTEHFISMVQEKLVFLVGGNHDAWSGTKDPLRWIMRQTASLYRQHAVRIEVHTDDGKRIRINARHDFKGISMWNPAHGPGRELQKGVRDHIAVCGHRHVSGHMILKDPDSGIAMHALQVASYKWIDHYAKEQGFPDQQLSPCAVTLIDTRLPDTHPDFIHVYWDPVKAAADLKALRAA